MKALAAGRAAKLLLVLTLSCALAVSNGCGAPHAVSDPKCTAKPPLSADDANNVTLLGPVDCAGSRTFTIELRTGVDPIGVWLSCLGTGSVRFSSPLTSFAQACGPGYSGGQSLPVHLRAGQKVVARIVAAPATKWELWIEGTPQASAPVSPSPAAPRVAQLTGRQLSAILLPELSLPGYTLSAKNPADSGTTVHANSRWTLPGMDCAGFVEQFPGPGFGETGYAQRVFATPANFYFSETIYQFGSPAAATSFFSGVRGEVGACRSFTGSPLGGQPEPWALRLSAAPPGIGGQATTIQENGTTAETSGTTAKVAAVNLLATRGADVLDVRYLGDGLPTTLSLAPVAVRLITRLPA